MLLVRRALVTLLLCLSFGSFAEASRSFAGLRATRSTKRMLDDLRLQARQGNRELEILAVLPADALTDSFGLEQRAFIRDWFSTRENVRTLPPNQPAGDEVAPALELDEILPPDIRKRVQPLPVALERQLPALAGNLRRIIVFRDIVLIEEDTSRIVDLIHSVLRAR